MLPSNVPLISLPWTGIDFESAGHLVGYEDAPVQIGFASMLASGQVVDQFVSYIALDRPVDRRAFSTHRISREMCDGAPSLNEMWPKISPWWQSSVVVAHNIPTERKFMRLFYMSGRPLWLDSLRLARLVAPSLPSHSLGALLYHYSLMDVVRGLVPGRGEHDALFDAVGALVLARSLLECDEFRHITSDMLEGASLKPFYDAKGRR